MLSIRKGGDGILARVPDIADVPEAAIAAQSDGPVAMDGRGLEQPGANPDALAAHLRPVARSDARVVVHPTLGSDTGRRVEERVLERLSCGHLLPGAGN